jgi:hypothetical protein
VSVFTTEHRAALEQASPAELAPILSTPGLSLSVIISAYESDQFCTSVLTVLKNGPDSHHFNDRYIRDRKGLIHRVDASAGKTRVLLPKAILPALLHRFHDSKLAGHPGVNPTFTNIRKHFVFSGSLFREVRNHIKVPRGHGLHRSLAHEPRPATEPEG